MTASITASVSGETKRDLVVRAALLGSFMTTPDEERFPSSHHTGGTNNICWEASGNLQIGF